MNIDELETKLKELRQKMDDAEKIEDWLKAYHEYLGAFIELHEAKTYEEDK